MSTNIEIGRYSVCINGSGGLKERARIILYDTDLQTIGTIIFLKDPDEAKSKDDNQTSTGFISVFQFEDQFLNTIDVLRNEKPVYLGYSPNWKTGYITTGQEPVGEGEMLG